MQTSTPATATTKPQSVREIALSLPEDHRTVIHRNGRAIVVFCRRQPLRQAYADAINAAIATR